MITYVDYVDYDGPAYRAGMREGDVILSINGNDMEKADHKTLVTFIKNCDTRMRMVVLFEDCVRKVELHMRYIKLQRVLQNKMEELERLCVRERQLLQGKWKTHSLPARKKLHRLITADQRHPPNPHTHIVGQQFQTCVSDNLHLILSGGDGRKRQAVISVIYVASFNKLQRRIPPHIRTPRYKDQQSFIVKTPCDQKQSRGNQTNLVGTIERQRKPYGPCQRYAGHLCNPCVQVQSSNGDNTSLDAYDLASPCCDPDVCRPAEGGHAATRTSTGRETPRLRKRKLNLNSNRYFHIGAGLVSQCSLHSCTSSEISNIVPTTVGESSANSYTTSLSTDTLYWDGSCDTSRQLSMKSTKHDHQRYSQQPQPHEPIYVQYSHVKPKSWDNLATKAFGGYGFGYGYLDTSGKCTQQKSSGSGSSSSRSNTKSQATQYLRSDSKQSASNPGNTSQYTPHTHRRYFQPTKSTESLLSVPKYSNEARSDSSLSCECLEAVSPGPDAAEARFFQSPRQSVASPTDPNLGYYSVRRTSRSDYQKNVISTSSEATRL
ncbi:hypothetical protein NQ317_012227 [Molorchus minor]|uniref:PDZ domain-containing protein n=1 Tax=Molorchus minor TaxID=1323400 RepID=A0ABQ9IXN2_9CUCU|nr:hypothetical protein NQ317_012227 [Molorchus minor]